MTKSKKNSFEENRSPTLFLATLAPESTVSKRLIFNLVAAAFALLFPIPVAIALITFNVLKIVSGFFILPVFFPATFSSIKEKGVLEFFLEKKWEFLHSLLRFATQVLCLMAMPFIVVPIWAILTAVDVSLNQKIFQWLSKNNPELASSPWVLWLFFGVDISQQNLTEGKPYHVSWVVTADGVLLKNIEIEAENDFNQKKKHLIYFPGNGEVMSESFFKAHPDLKEIHKQGIDITLFNYRGVRQGDFPSSSKDLVYDGLAQVERLLAKGIPPEDIVLWGQSLGGGVATLVAKELHSKGAKVNLFNTRSFSSISAVIDSMELASIFQRFLKGALSLFEWEISAGKIYQEIPEGYKQSLCVKEDNVILEKASLVCFLKKQQNSSHKASFEESLEMVTTRNSRNVHSAPLLHLSSMKEETNLFKKNGKDYLIDFINSQEDCKNNCRKR